MADPEERVPDPSLSDEPTPDAASAFAGMTPEIIDLVFPNGPENTEPGDFAMPNHKATKPKWWKRGKRINESDNPKPTKPKKPMPSMAPTALHKGLVDFYRGAAIVVMPFRPELAMAVSAQAEACADAWVELSKTNPAIKRFLIGLVTTSATGVLVMAHAPILIAAFMAFAPGANKNDDSQSYDWQSAFMKMTPKPDGDYE